MATVLKAPDRWLGDRPVSVWVVGAGGNGGEVVDALAQFHTALLALGGAGLSVTILDDAQVREVNLVRQRFWRPDIGQYKAIALANRYNMLLGCDWVGLPHRLEPLIEGEMINGSPDVLITAVDLASTRRWVASHRWRVAPIWLDLGNNARNGQAVIGIPGSEQYPTVVDHYPELHSLEDNTSKSCSTAEAIASQDCLVNRVVATAGMTLLWELLRYGETDKNGLVIDMVSGMQVPLSFPISELAS